MKNIPFDADLDDYGYVYRFQDVDRLLQMKEAVGEYIAPYIWGPSACKHEKYVRLSATLPENMAIYTMSVWRSEKDAREELRRYPRSGAERNILMRIPRCSIEETGLSCVDDDYLPGQAFLLYEVASSEGNQVYGRSRIAWSEVEMCNTHWQELDVWKEERVYAVKNAYSKTYVINQLYEDQDDAGLPPSEKLIRSLLHRLASLEGNLASLPAWRAFRRHRTQGAYEMAAAILAHALNSSEEYRRVGIRLRTHLPECHHWRRYLDQTIK